jgi:tetratricopeptide (TPR) repeat protein
LYLALAEVQEYISTEDAEIIDRVRVHLDKAVNFLPQLSNNHISNVYYHRAVINLYVNDFDKAVADVDKAIEKSEDNIPRYFYLRGLIFACCGNFSQAVQDLSVAINLDENFAKAFLERAKCLQMEGNPNEAFLDLQKYITLRPEDPLIHKYAGFLLFQNCAY